MYELHIALRKRSLEYLKASEETFIHGFYSASGLISQISAELAVKATIAFLGYSFPETHEIRKLLSVLSTLILKDEISAFIKAKGGAYPFRRW
ncbi:HEPN domain-containing protein [Sulfolobus sp. S-194]|uniref:HEPN domain-containing protein n=1 Tax=Sulfolobus sp. S-194 TaxID=2512240 RepID=UPI00256FE39B|nr:HEPN domain-containing protein [Sulfolobus sp. S-194]